MAHTFRMDEKNTSLALGFEYPTDYVNDITEIAGLT